MKIYANLLALGVLGAMMATIEAFTPNTPMTQSSTALHSSYYGGGGGYAGYNRNTGSFADRETRYRVGGGGGNWYDRDRSYIRGGGGYGGYGYGSYGGYGYGGYTDRGGYNRESTRFRDGNRYRRGDYRGDAAVFPDLSTSSSSGAMTPLMDRRGDSLSFSRGGLTRSMGGGDGRLTRGIWDNIMPVTVQGKALKTWSFRTPDVERIHVLMRTDGRQLHSNVDLWQGPDNSPMRLKVYLEDGNLRPFSAVIETPGGYNAVAIRNTGQLEFPFEASVEADMRNYRYGGGRGYGRYASGLGHVPRDLDEHGVHETIQGSAIQTYPFDPDVASVQVLLQTDGRPLNARVELLQGPNNKKQAVEVYCEDGLERPFFCIMETPGPDNVVRIVNTGTVEFPLTACVEPYIIDYRSGYY